MYSNLPINKNIIQIDINWTLIPSDLSEHFREYFSSRSILLKTLQSQSQSLKDKWYLLTLNSDSPMLQMKELSEFLQLPWLSENLIIWEKGKNVVYNGHSTLLSDNSTMTLHIRTIANELSIVIWESLIAPEFWGKVPNFTSWKIHLWANRQATISLRWNKQDLKKLLEVLKETYDENHFDYAPDHNFLWYTTGSTTTAKQETNAILRERSNHTLLIWDSTSDIDKDYALVGNNNVTNPPIKPIYISPYNHAEWVVDILEKINESVINF